jgi:hypothetical protein
MASGKLYARRVRRFHLFFEGKHNDEPNLAATLADPPWLACYAAKRPHDAARHGGVIALYFSWNPWNHA